MTPQEEFYNDIEAFDIPNHVKSYLKVAADLYASKKYGEGFEKSQEIREKTLSILN